MSWKKKKKDVGYAFRNDSQLQQFVLTDVTPTGRVLGTGSYGSVVEVSYKHLVCAGKRLHETLIDVENEGVADVVQKYLQECQLMSSLHHPNITQFLGLCFLPETQLPLLVMERLETSLDDLLEHMLNLPLSIKCGILNDVACGLLYLHDRQSPVIHRDLTSKNVLLTSSLVAKITDMGNSRIAKSGQPMTAYPGTLVYMPPEAQDDIHRYGASMDIFSFGHLALYVLIQKFPGELLPSTYPNPDKPHEVKGRTEVERRVVYIEQLESQFHPGLVELVKQCLRNKPSERPTTEQVLTKLQGIKTDVEGEHGRGVLRLDLEKLKMSRESKKKDDTIEDLMQQQARLEEEMKNNEKQLEGSQKKLKELHEEILANQMKAKNDLAHKETEIAAKEEDFQRQFKKLEEEFRAHQIKAESDLASKDMELSAKKQA